VVAYNVQFSRPAEIWTLSASFPDVPALRAIRALDVVARLKPGVTMEAAQAELAVIADGLAREYPEANNGTGVIVEPIRAGIVGSDLQTTSIFLLGVVGFVLLLCCANVANLLLARMTARAREIAVRSALGAERRRIIGQLLTESLVLAAVGGMLGIVIGAAIVRAAPALIPPGLLPAAVSPTFDVRVVLFGLGAALAVGVVFGVVPAWQATGTSIAGLMASESRSATATSGRPRSAPAGDGGGLRRTRVHRSATAPRNWRAHGARGEQRARDVARGSRCRLDDRGRSAAGMVLAALSGRLIAAFLFGVEPLDPLTFVGVPVVILLTALAAAAAPAWRATRINPVEAFRHEG
jgi:hypothetical protein